MGVKDMVFSNPEEINNIIAMMLLVINIEVIDALMLEIRTTKKCCHFMARFRHTRSERW